MSGAPSSTTPVPGHGPLRWLRGGVVGVVAALLAAGGHAVGGGSLPGDGRLLALLAGSVLVSVALSGRRWSLGALLLVLLGAQVVLHVGFADTSQLMPGMTSDAVGLQMLAGHVLAAVATAALLRRGEDWCWALVELLTRAIAVPRPGSVPVGARTPVADPRGPVVPLLHARVPRRRGPPVLLPT